MLCEWCFLVGLLWESGVVVQVFMQQQLAGLLAHPNKQARAEEEEEEEEEEKEETENICGDNDPKLLLLILLSSSSSLQFLASILLRGPNPRSPVVSMSSSVTRLSSSPPPSSPDAAPGSDHSRIYKSWKWQLLLLLDEEEDRQQRQEDQQQALAYVQWQQQHARRRAWLQQYYGQLQSLYADLNVLESCRLRQACVAAAALGAAVSTQQSVQRRLWVKNRSQAWWAQCNHPGFPDIEFHRAFRMSRPTFDRICEQLAVAVAKEDTMLRAAIPVQQRVAVCIWRLATGEPLRLVSKRFGLGISTCHKMVLEVCAAINDVLLPKYVQWPTDERLQQVMQEYEAISGMHNVLGALYTTHIPIIAPKINVASYFNKRHTEHNHKTSYSITLQGMVDIHGSFTDVCIGWPGSMADERVLEKSALFQRGTSGDLQGMYVVGGQGYPLLDWLLVPYVQHNLTWAQHAFNEKVVEVLRVAKSAFCRLKGRWRFLLCRTEVKLQELPAVLRACCVLHNVCEMHHERFDPALMFDLVDYEMLPEQGNVSLSAIQSRDTIAHNLLHNIHMGSSFL